MSDATAGKFYGVGFQAGVRLPEASIMSVASVKPGQRSRLERTPAYACPWVSNMAASSATRAKRATASEPEARAP